MQQSMKVKAMITTSDPARALLNPAVFAARIKFQMEFKKSLIFFVNELIWQSQDYGSC